MTPGAAGEPAPVNKTRIVGFTMDHSFQPFIINIIADRIYRLG